MAMASFTHGVFAHAGELEDDQFPANSSSVYVWPPFLSAAEKYHLSGKELIWLAIVSWEVSTGLCTGHDAANLAGFSMGFAPIAIAAALGKPLKLSFEETVNATSIAASKYSCFPLSVAITFSKKDLNRGIVFCEYLAIPINSP